MTKKKTLMIDASPIFVIIMTATLESENASEIMFYDTLDLTVYPTEVDEQDITLKTAAL